MSQRWRISCSTVFATAILTLTSLIKADVKVLCIGDSLTREYDIMSVDNGEGGTFPSPDSNPGVANTMNWVEILTAKRNSDFDFGHYATQGHDYNYAVPGYDSVMWIEEIIEAGFTDPLFYVRFRMREDYDEVDVVVIMVGGNDVRGNYGDLYDPEPGDVTPTQFKNTVLTNLGKIIDEIRDVNETVPIVLADVPDLTAAPDIIADHPDPAKRANVTVIVNELNQDIAALAANRGATLAPVSSLTDRLLSPDPVYIGAIEMIKDKDPMRNNRPLYLFCKEGLHPSTNGQAVIANTMVTAINTATGSSIQPLASREIISLLPGIEANQPYLGWAGAAGLTDLSMTADADGDGIPNLGEYLLGLNPLVVNNDHLMDLETIDGADTLTLSYTPDTDALLLADVEVKYSTQLESWLPLPSGSLIDMGNGTFQVQLPTADIPGGNDRAFLRMEFVLKP
ncbi:hypothetical protein NT6N_11040 [Oceaniferula spumae]|uniref:SGNH hydrolase-type esterase domain-containing protein n=1 Tax=Oceaniferula spumae TaxID=2979115 RepID=A0AAT9FJB6_9BACT